jgi:CheY-specific phosphatase CheX
MCSEKWPDLLGPDAADVMLDAVTRVAERCFFAVVEPCSEPPFATVAGETSRWMIASVHFTEGDCAGAISCTLSEDLAGALFDAFSGRDPSDSPPQPEQVLDLVGEFSNMICGTWLTRMATQQTFVLSRPIVQRAPAPPQIVGPHTLMLLAVNDLPLAIEVRLARAGAGATAASGA